MDNFFLSAPENTEQFPLASIVSVNKSEVIFFPIGKISFFFSFLAVFRIVNVSFVSRSLIMVCESLW